MTAPSTPTAVAARRPGVLVVSGEVATDQETAFAAAVDWVAQREWIPLTRVRVVSGDGRSVGSEIHAFTGVGRLGFLDVLRITAWDPPHRVETLHVGRVVRGPGVFEFAPVRPGVTRFVWAEYLDLPLGRLGRLGWPLVRPVVGTGFRVALRRFARYAERRRRQGPVTGR